MKRIGIGQFRMNVGSITEPVEVWNRLQKVGDFIPATTSLASSDTFEMSNIPSGSSVTGVNVGQFARKDDPGERTVIDPIRHSLDKVRIEEEEPIRPVANGARPGRGKVVPDKLPTVFRADKVGAGFGHSRPAPKK